MVAYEITSLINVAQKFITQAKCDYDQNGYISGRKEEFMVMNAMGVESMNELLKKNTSIELDESGKTYKSLKYFFNEENKDSRNEILGNIATNLNKMYLLAQESYGALVRENENIKQLMTKIQEKGDLEDFCELKKKITKTCLLIDVLGENMKSCMKGPDEKSDIWFYALDEEIYELMCLKQELDKFTNQIENLPEEQQKFAIMNLGKHEIFENVNLITEEFPKIVKQYKEFGENDVELVKNFIDKASDDEGIESLYENACPLTRRLIKSWAEYVYDQNNITGINENSQNNAIQASVQLSFKTTEKQNNKSNVAIYTAIPSGHGLYRIFKTQIGGIKQPIDGVYTKEELQQQYPQFFD